MRLTTVILIAALMQVSAAGLAQKITISKKQADLRAVLKVLRTQSGYNFVYADNGYQVGCRPDRSRSPGNGEKP